MFKLNAANVMIDVLEKLQEATCKGCAVCLATACFDWNGLIDARHTSQCPRQVEEFLRLCERRGHDAPIEGGFDNLHSIGKTWHRKPQNW